jgi:hypothetical protein
MVPTSLGMHAHYHSVSSGRLMYLVFFVFRASKSTHNVRLHSEPKYT